MAVFAFGVQKAQMGLQKVKPDSGTDMADDSRDSQDGEASDV